MKPFYKDLIEKRAKILVFCLDDKMLKHKLGTEDYNVLKRALFKIASDVYKREGHDKMSILFDEQADKYGNSG